MRRLTPPVCMVAVLLACTVAPRVAQTASDRIVDRMPMDDPSVAPRAHAATPATPPLPRTSSYLAAVAGAAMDVLAWSARTLAYAPDATGQLLWEVSYVFGLNSTPIRPPQAADDRPRGMPSPASSGAPGAGSTRPGPPAAPSPPIQPVVADPAVPPAVPMPTMPIGTQDTADPGLISNFVYDRARRREDGTFFVPKPLQRLFNVRVEQARTTDMPLVTRIPGRIVPDPSEHGTVQPSVPGRLGPPDTGFPTLGQTVIQGQVLAWVSPSIGVVDRSQVRRDVVRLTTEIRVETETLEILRQFVWVPFREGKLYQSEQRLAGLRRERDALLPVLELREALRSPTDGVISATTAVNGKIVQPGETVFDVIDPTHLWVEATAPDPSAADVARGAPIAAAVTPEGTILTLRFIGTGLSVARQATPVMYRIENPPPGLRVGRPLSVTVVNKAQSERGILLNRSAVTQGSSGVEEVWEQVGPESFVPHPVRTHVIDGASVLVLDGVADGARIVVNGTRLMAQLQ